MPDPYLIAWWLNEIAQPIAINLGCYNLDLG